MSNMRNLTLASAKHLMTMGHITPAHHARIVKSVSPKRRKQPAPRMFGSLAQQAQAPIPGISPGDMAQIPAGTSSGYSDE